MLLSRTRISCKHRKSCELRAGVGGGRPPSAPTSASGSQGLRARRPRAAAGSRAPLGRERRLPWQREHFRLAPSLGPAPPRGDWWKRLPLGVKAGLRLAKRAVAQCRGGRSCQRGLHHPAGGVTESAAKQKPRPFFPPIGQRARGPAL